MIHVSLLYPVTLDWITNRLIYPIHRFVDCPPTHALRSTDIDRHSAMASAEWWLLFRFRDFTVKYGQRVHTVLIVDAWCLGDSASALTDGYNITLCILQEIAQNLVDGDCSHCSIHVDSGSHGVGFGARHDSLLTLIRPSLKSSYSNTSISTERNADPCDVG